MKKILLIYQDEVDGFRVKGHESRCDVIANALSERHMTPLMVPRSLVKDIRDGESIGPVDAIIIDGGINVPEGIENSGPIVRIADLPEHIYEGDDFLIAPGYGAERIGDFRNFDKERFYNIAEDRLRGILGLSAFPVHPHISEYRDRWENAQEDKDVEWIIDGEYVLFIPGSNRKGFYSVVDRGDEPIFDTLELELSGVNRETAITLIANAKVVVTAASVSAIESILLGRPTFLVKTADDQIWNYTFMIEDGVALPFHHGTVRMYLEEPSMREALTKRVLWQTRHYTDYLIGGLMRFLEEYDAVHS